jgi:hypothetical protein
MRSLASELLSQARRRAKDKDIPFTLTRAELDSALVRANGRCEMTGRAFDSKTYSGRRRPFAPSIDRIDSSKGYHAQNIRIVCVATNAALAEFGDKVLYSLFEAMMLKLLSEKT